MTRRTSVATAAALALAAVGTFGTLGSPAAAAGIGSATAVPASFANTVKAQTVSVTTSSPSVAYTLGTGAQLVGPGSLTDTYAGTATTAAAGTTSSSFSTKFDLVTAGGLPAAPGKYELDGCTLNCSVTVDSGIVTVTGAAPAPGVLGSPAVIAAGSSGAITIPGQGFAKDEVLSIPRPGGSASDVTSFTENNVTSTASSLAGTLGIGGSVPAGVYDLKVTDQAGHSGYCASCLEVTSGSVSGPGPVRHLHAVPNTANTATITWQAPSTGTTATSYKVVVAKNSTTTTDHGLTVTVDQANHRASVSGLSGSSAYYVTVSASDGTNQGLPSTTALNTPNPTGLSLRASRTSLVAGKAVQLSGLLVHKVGSNPSSGLAGQDIVIAAKSDSGKVRTVGTTHTGAQGRYHFTAYPTTDSTYAAYFAGAPEAKGAPDSPALSNAFPKVSVAPLVVAAAQATTIGRHAKSVRVLGFVSPNEHGRKVQLVRIGGTGSIFFVGHATLNRSSHYAIRGRVPKSPGTYTFDVRVSSRVGNIAGRSVKFHVRRK